MRISTIGFQTDAMSQMQQLETALAQTQSQLSSGKQLQTAADNPAGMTQVNVLNAQLSASQQYVTNGNAASANLNLEDQALTDATNLLQSARDLAVEANNSSLTAAQRQDIATQLQQQLQDLVAIGNRTDANGNYLFAGYASNTQPFAQSGGSVSYNGSSSVSQVQISANQRVSASDSGASIFMNTPAGNGTFTTSVAAANTGSASIDPGSVTNPAAWVPDTYTITFSSPTQYQVVNSSNTVVASGNSFSSGDAIDFNGVQVTISGTPAAGDQFTVAPAGKTSAFATLANLATTLSSSGLSNAQLATQIGAAVQQIDGALTQVGDVQASVGARINSITTAQSTQQTSQTSLQTQVSQLSDVDYAAAITKLNTEEVSLQAAQESYASLARMSLFNYLS
jgi:flagellar hook-associated protein 3 FlgL